MWYLNIVFTGMYYTTRLDEVVGNVAKHHLNTIYPSVWNRGHTLHPSPIAEQAGGLLRDPRASLPLLPFGDVLSGLVQQAHRQHLRLIPWFEYGLMIPVNSAIAKSHPDWLTVTQSGEKTKDFAGWLNPFHPEVQQFIVNLIVDVAKRYPIDGIQLDDHFGLPIEFGYDVYTTKLYQKEYGRKPPSNPANAQWMAWRAEKLTQLMRKITLSVKAVRPRAVVSLSPNSPDFAYSKYLQDWRSWVRLGLLDEVVVQVYRQDLASFKSELYNGGFYSLQNLVPVSIGLYTGPFLGAKSIQRLQKEVKAVQAASYSGVSFFSWETTLWLFKKSPAQAVEKVFVELFQN
ncbi:family 10 glycosylhydrolase [Iningainema tapete]|uniref:Family 10 glycosylhydrolase n=1 Tax=Iningainema tapete BLCC-T55 TaxID=2748662 RepID=A0A8J6XI97_9CYAN|nr:family 10 glycosylhydrolase [Iningainema tapete BLCC-T55]